MKSHKVIFSDCSYRPAIHRAWMWNFCLSSKPFNTVIVAVPPAMSVFRTSHQNACSKDNVLKQYLAVVVIKDKKPLHSVLASDKPLNKLISFSNLTSRIIFHCLTDIISKITILSLWQGCRKKGSKGPLPPTLRSRTKFSSRESPYPKMPLCYNTH